VTDDNDSFIGVLYLKDLERTNYNESLEKYVVKGVPYVRPDSTFEDCLDIMARLKSRWVCVIKDGKYLGVLTMDQLLKVYREKARR
jgi:CIC family chloride channel protein